MSIAPTLPKQLRCGKFHQTYCFLFSYFLFFLGLYTTKCSSETSPLQISKLFFFEIPRIPTSAVFLLNSICNPILEQPPAWAPDPIYPYRTSEQKHFTNFDDIKTLLKQREGHFSVGKTQSILGRIKAHAKMLGFMVRDFGLKNRDMFEVVPCNDQCNFIARNLDELNLIVK